MLRLTSAGGADAALAAAGAITDRTGACGANRERRCGTAISLHLMHGVRGSGRSTDADGAALPARTAARLCAFA